MFEVTRQSKYASLLLNTEKQNIEAIQDILKRIAGMAGCEACGRMAFLHVHFLSDPVVELPREVVIDFEQQGLRVG